jgi:hypothetical protein
MHTLDTTLLRLRARANQLPEPHRRIARACTQGRPQLAELMNELNPKRWPHHRQSLHSALDDLQRAGIVVVEPMFTPPPSRRVHSAPLAVLRTVITPEGNAA